MSSPCFLPDVPKMFSKMRFQGVTSLFSNCLPQFPALSHNQFSTCFPIVSYFFSLVTQLFPVFSHLSFKCCLLLIVHCLAALQMRFSNALPILFQCSRNGSPIVFQLFPICSNCLPQFPAVSQRWSQEKSYLPSIFFPNRVP